MAVMSPVVASPLFKVVRLFGTIKLVKLAVLAKAPLPILVKAVVDKSRAVKPEPAKAPWLIVVTLLGMSIDVKLVVPLKALSLIVVNPAGSLTLVKPAQFRTILLGTLVIFV